VALHLRSRLQRTFAHPTDGRCRLWKSTLDTPCNKPRGALGRKVRADAKRPYRLGFTELDAQDSRGW
jgi:hypothetical protein